MVYKYYKECRDAAWKMLIDYNVDTMPVPIVRLCREMGIVMKYYKPNDTNDGKTLYIDGVPYILINEDIPKERKRFVIAHELGHIVLGHIEDDGSVLFHSEKSQKTPIENEATAFALRLLAPACVLNGCSVENADEIERICQIPSEPAKLRMKRMKLLYKRNKFLTSPDEKAVFENFSSFIEQYNFEKNK